MSNQNGTKLLWKCLPLRRSHIPNSKKITLTIPKIQVIKLSKNELFLSSFCTLNKNCFNSQVHAPIWLKFGTLIGGSKANLSSNFRVKTVKISRVMNDFTRNTKSNFCYAYRLNLVEEQVGNRNVARFSIKEVPFDG